MGIGAGGKVSGFGRSKRGRKFPAYQSQEGSFLGNPARALQGKQGSFKFTDDTASNQEILRTGPGRQPSAGTGNR